MEVIDLKKTTIYVDDIQRIYMETNYSPERYNIQTTNGTFLVDREDYYKVKDCLLSLNNEVEITENKKIEKLYEISNIGDLTIKYPDNKQLIDKINEIIDYINGGTND